MPHVKASLMLVLALMGCARASHTKVGPDLFAITCQGGRTKCYEEASRVCGNGFDVTDGSDRTQSFTTGAADTQTTQTTPQKSNSDTTAGAWTWNSYEADLLVRCRPWPIPMPPQ